MPPIHQKWVMDREAYTERRAVMEVEGGDSLEASSVASDVAYKTRVGQVSTAAAREDWAPVRTWYAELAARFGEQTAQAVIQDIHDTVREELLWRG